MFELVNIFDAFLPQLLQDPNPKDPLNGEAAMLLLKDPEKYKLKVKEYVKKYAAKDQFQKSTIKESAPANNVVSTLNNGVDHKNGSKNVEESNSVHSELSNASDYQSD